LDIVQAINDADPIAFKKLFEQHWKKIYHIALQKLPREEDASDITQEVFYLIWKNRGYWKIKTNIEAYLQGMLRHKIYDFYAQRDRLPILIPLNEQEEYWHYSFQEAEREDYSYENQLVRKEIEAMPEKMREIFILGRFENLSASLIPEVCFKSRTMASASFWISVLEGIFIPSTLSSFINEATFVLLLLRFTVAFILPDPLELISTSSTTSKQPVNIHTEQMTSRFCTIFFTILNLK